MSRGIEYFKELHKIGLPKPEDIKRMVETIDLISKEVTRLEELGDKLSPIEISKSMTEVARAIIKYQQ